jgi:hypothetical protein
MIKDNSKKRQVKPTNLDDLGESIRLLQDAKDALLDDHARFDPLLQCSV